jgi:hypothetical protein
MSRYRRGFVSQHKEQLRRAGEQARLREKHSIKDEGVVVVEKANTFKFTVKTLLFLVRFAATVVLLTLAAIGLLALIYPMPREAVTSVIEGTIAQTKEMLGLWPA